MKIRNILALVAVSCMLIFASCKKGSEGGIPDHLKIIPANSMVMSINAKTLVDKGGLSNYKDFELYKKFHKEIAKYEPEATKFIDEFLKDTRSSGLNLDHIYAYFQVKDGHNALGALTFGVDDQNKVAKWIAKYHKISNERDYELVEGNGYKVYRLNYSSILVWDKSKALLLNLSEYEEDAITSFESMLKIDEENSIISNADFMECYNVQNDFTIWFPFKMINQMSGDDSPELSALSALGEDWENASVDISVNFTNEKATMSWSVWPASVIENYYSKHPIFKDKFDLSLLSYLPSEYLFSSKVSLNVQEYYKLILDSFTKLEENLNNGEEDNDDDYYYGYNPLGNHDYMSNLVDIISSDKVAKTINSFKGDIVASIFGFNEGLIPMPQFGIAVSINGEEAFNHLLGLIPESISLTKADRYYSYEIPQVMTLYASQKDDLMYITNHKEALDNFLGQGYKENLSTSSIAEKLNSYPIFYSLNLDINKYPVFITTILREAVGRLEYNLLTNIIIEPFSSLNIEYAGKNSFEMNVVLKENKENSFKVILNAIDKYVSEMF